MRRGNVRKYEGPSGTAMEHGGSCVHTSGQAWISEPLERAGAPPALSKVVEKRPVSQPWMTDGGR